MSKPNIDDRIKVLEATLLLPGTQITRVFRKDSGVQWSLGLGHIMRPKTFYTGPTIEDVLSQAEHDLIHGGVPPPDTVEDALAGKKPPKRISKWK